MRDIMTGIVKAAEEEELESVGLDMKENTKKTKKKRDVYDTDIRNSELVIDAHSKDPFEVMRIQTYDDAPMANANDDIVVRVEASTVCDLDCRIREGTYNWKFGRMPSFPMVPGVDCVGIITSVGSMAIKAGLDLGDRVAALSLNGCTAKYVRLKIDEVIKVPDEVDPAEAVAVIRTYTAAFQALMLNVTGMNRYSRKPMQGDKVLIVGPCGLFERALVELSFYLGAKKVYFSCTSTNQKSHDMYIRMMGARPLSKDPEDWSEDLEGKIDVAVDSAGIDRFEHSYASLTESGILVVAGMQSMEQDDIISNIERTWVKTYVAMNPRCDTYGGIIENYLSNRKEFMKDLIFLFNALEKGKIKPKVATKIPMKKVAAAQERLDISNESLERRGVIVVEPWLMVDDEES